MQTTSIDIEASLATCDRQYAEGCVKIEEDLDRYRRAIERANVGIVIECGTFSGKSALWFARQGLCVFTVDTTPHIDPNTAEAWLAPGVCLTDWVGNSTDLATVKYARDWSEGANAPAPEKGVMVTLDSDHSFAHVLAEMELYGPLVTPGSYMIVEDTLLRWMPISERRHYIGTPMDAIETWLARYGDQWEIDTEIEALHSVSQFPYGWLRKKAM